MWSYLWELVSSITSDELRREKLLTNLTLLGLATILAVYVIFLFLPYKASRERTHSVIILTSPELRKFKEYEGEVKLQWNLIAERMSYDDRTKRSLILNGILEIYDLKTGNRSGRIEFKRAFGDERVNYLRMITLKVIYSNDVIYALEGELQGEHLYLRDLKIVNLENPDEITISPKGVLYKDKLSLENPINIKSEASDER